MTRPCNVWDRAGCVGCHAAGQQVGQCVLPTTQVTHQASDALSLRHGWQHCLPLASGNWPGTGNWTTAQAAPISCQVVPVQAKQDSQQHCLRWGIGQTLSCWSCPAALRHSSSGQPPWGGLPSLWACNTVPLATCPMCALGSAQLRVQALRVLRYAGADCNFPR